MLYCNAARPRGSDLLLSCKVYVYQQDLVEKELSNNARKVNFTCFLLHDAPRVQLNSERWKYFNMSAFVRSFWLLIFILKQIPLSYHHKLSRSDEETFAPEEKGGI